MTKRTQSSKYYKIETPEGILHVHINYNESDKKITDIFLRIPPLGTALSSFAAILGVVISKYIQQGGDPEKLIKHFNSVKSNKKIIIDENTSVESIPQAIGLCLMDYYKNIRQGEEK